MRRISFWEAVATMIGSTVGAGILAIPYSIAQVGFIPGMVLMIVMGLASTMMNLMVANISLKTDAFHLLPGYAGTYLGQTVKKMTFTNTVIASYGALLAYIIGQGQVLAGIFDGKAYLWSLAFFLVGSCAIFLGMNMIKKLVVLMVFCVLGILILLGAHSYESVKIHNLFIFNPQNWIVPYGVLLFAFHGTLGVLEARKELIGQEKLLKKAIIVSGMMIFGIYTVFTLLTLGVTGVGTTPVATIGLKSQLGPVLGLIGNALAVFTMGTCFITIGYGMRQMYQHDYGKPRLTAWLLVVSVPLLLFLLGIRSFIEVVTTVGGLVMGLNSVILVVTYWNARVFGKRRAEFSLGKLHVIGFLLMGIFITGAIITVLNI